MCGLFFLNNRHWTQAHWTDHNWVITMGPFDFSLLKQKALLKYSPCQFLAIQVYISKDEIKPIFLNSKPIIYVFIVYILLHLGQEM